MPGRVTKLDINARYDAHLLGYVDPRKLKPLKVVVNAGNGGAGMVIDRLEPHLPFQFIKVHHEPDGTFPNGVPNPMLEENRQSTIEAIRAHKADVGLAWDGDFDRCFFFDEHGTFIEGYYLVGLLAEVFLKREKGGRIVHDPRLTWNTLDLVAQQRWQGGAVEVRPCLHQAGDARQRCHLRRRDERAPLLPRLRLRRLRHDSAGWWCCR